MEQTDNFLSLFERVASNVENGKKLPTITADSKITSLGIDSVSMMEIIGEIEDELDIRLPDEKLANLETVADIERVVKEQIGNA